MTRKVTLSGVNSELRIATAGISINVVDDVRERSGRLRIGKAKIAWKPKYKQIEVEKTWAQLIDFFTR